MCLHGHLLWCVRLDIYRVGVVLADRTETTNAVIQHSSTGTNIFRKGFITVPFRNWAICIIRNHVNGGFQTCAVHLPIVENWLFSHQYYFKVLFCLLNHVQYISVFSYYLLKRVNGVSCRVSHLMYCSFAPHPRYMCTLASVADPEGVPWVPWTPLLKGCLRKYYAQLYYVH